VTLPRENNGDPVTPGIGALPLPNLLGAKEGGKEEKETLLPR